MQVEAVWVASWRGYEEDCPLHGSCCLAVSWLWPVQAPLLRLGQKPQRETFTSVAGTRDLIEGEC